MLSKNGSKFFNTVVFRLTVWFAIFFTAALVTVFMISQSILSSNLAKITDQDLLAASQEYDHDITKDDLEELRTFKSADKSR